MNYQTSKKTVTVVIFIQMLISIGLAFLLDTFLIRPMVRDLSRNMSLEFFNAKVYLVFFLQVLVIFALFQLILRKRVDRLTFLSLSLVYIALLFVSLFGSEGSLERAYNFDLFSLMYVENLQNNILNFLLFFPLGYYMRKRSFGQLMMVSFVGIVLVEIIQFYNRRGLFNIHDIVIALLAIGVAHYLANKHEIELCGYGDKSFSLSWTSIFLNKVR